MHDWTDVLKTAQSKSIFGSLRGRNHFSFTNQSLHFCPRTGQRYQPIFSPTQGMFSTIFSLATMLKRTAALLAGRTQHLHAWLMPSSHPNFLKV
jgi:hypothetical protein